MKIRIGIIMLFIFITGCKICNSATVTCDSKSYEAKNVFNYDYDYYGLTLYDGKRLNVPKDICIVEWHD